MSGGRGRAGAPAGGGGGLRGRLGAALKKLAKPRRLLAACYAAGAALWLLGGLACLAMDRALPQTVLTAAAAAALEQLEPAGAGAYRTAGVDSQMVFENLGSSARLVLLQADFSGEPGELELFYNRAPGQPFTAGRGFIGIPVAGGGTQPLVTLFGRRVIGRPLEGGTLYSLPPGRVEALRVDFGVYYDVGVSGIRVVMNPRLPAGHYLLPTPRALLGLAVGPVLACCCILTIMELGCGFAKKRKKGGAEG